MGLYDLDINKLNMAIAGKITRCPLCQKPETLSAIPKLMELREYQGGGLNLGGSLVAPLAVLVCSNCGNTILLNAFASGLISNDDKEKKEAVDHE